MKKLALFSLAFAAVAAMLITTSGCETSAVEDSQLTVTPSKVTLGPSESVKFTANGGWLYKWTISPDDCGVLSSYTGDTVTYTAPTETVTKHYDKDGNLTSTEAISSVTISVYAASNLTANAVITFRNEE